MRAQEIIDNCLELQQFWLQRNSQFKEWYELITMVDKLKEEKMESFVSNEPRTFFDLSLHLLTPSTLAHRIPLETIAPEDMADVDKIEKFLSDVWMRLERQSLLRGRGGFLRELVSYLLITGWYSILSLATDNEIIAEIWNPAEVYPEFSDDGLVRCAHIYSLTARAANRKIELKGWKVSKQTTPVKIYDYWTMEDGVVKHAIVIGNEVAVDLTIEPGMEKIPIYCSPVAGLPDRGAIVTGQDWKKQVGQSIMAADVNIFNYINKYMTFMMQLIRDAAQPRWVEKGTGEAKVKPEDIFRRGAVFHLGLNESLEPLASPPIPVELRAVLFDIAVMRQKGSLPDALYGVGVERMSGYLMAQVSAAVAHILRPYLEALKFLLGELDNDWLSDIHKFNLRPYGVRLPRKEFPRVEVDLKLEIPGDIVQRATVARMLDPQFSLSTETVTDMLFPEIRNPLAEQAKVQKTRAMQHPVIVQLQLVEALRERARILAAEGDTQMAAIYAQAVQTLLGQRAAPTEAAPPAAPPEIPEEFR